MLFEIQVMKVAIFFFSRSQYCHIYHMINNDSITGYIVKYNHRSRDPKEPIGNVYLAIHINEVFIHNVQDYF
jgi:hypothetical protein